MLLPGTRPSRRHSNGATGCWRRGKHSCWIGFRSSAAVLRSQRPRRWRVARRSSFCIALCRTASFDPRGHTALDPADIFDLLGALVDHSLVQRVETSGEDPRFRLFETVRQLTTAKLAARGETARTALRHAIWFHTRAESAWGADGVPLLERHWLEALDTDLENLRAALDFFSEHDPARTAIMASALVWFYYTRAHRLEGIRTIERVAPMLDRSGLPPVARARIGFSLGSLLMLLPATRSAGVEALKSALAEFEAAGHCWGTGYTLVALGVLREDDGDYPAALDYLARARPWLEAVNDPVTLANVDSIPPFPSSVWVDSARRALWHRR